MFHIALALVFLALIVHVARTTDRTRERIGELTMLYVLVGYCGVPMLAFMVVGLWNGPLLADWLGFPPDNPFQGFATVALLAMSLLSLLTVRYRGPYLIGPAVVWSVFFLGATFIHVADFHSRGGMTHSSALLIFATHGLIAIVLLPALWMSGVWRSES